MKVLAKSCVIGLAVVGLALVACVDVTVAQTPGPNYIAGVAATASSSWGGSGPNFNRDIRHTVDGTDRDTGAPDDNTLTPNNGKGMWMSNGGGDSPPDGVNQEACNGGPCNPFAEFDLGSVVALDRVDIYNYNEGCCSNRGIATMDVQYSADGGTNTTSLGNVSLAAAPGGPFGGVPSLSLSFGGASANWVRFDNLTDLGNGNVVGLNEVEFYQVPEPSSLVLLALSLLGLVGIRRRK